VLRFLLRMARARNVMPAAGFETAMRGIDELGRMVHGWRVASGERGGLGAWSEGRGAENTTASGTSTSDPQALEIDLQAAGVDA